MDRPRYRVEHRIQGTCIVLGETDDWAMTALAPYAVQLVDEHGTGELVLIEQASGRVVDRRRLWPEPSNPSD